MFIRNYGKEKLRIPRCNFFFNCNRLTPNSGTKQYFCQKVCQNCSVSHILQNIFLCVQQNKHIHTGLELLEGWVNDDSFNFGWTITLTLNSEKEKKITDESHSIMNAISCSLSVNYGSVLTAAPFESRWWRFTANHGTGFTDEMRIRIAFD